jgi:membrane associated rhomboid family serine protease
MDIELNVTLFVVLITVGISLISFRDKNKIFERKWSLNPYIMHRRKEYWRFLTSAFIHADTLHLVFNMYVLWQFGTAIEKHFDVDYGNNKILEAAFYLGMYIPAAILSSFYSFEKNKHNIHYSALGASGAVSAVVFAYIGLVPTQTFLVMAIIPVPAFIYGILFLIISWILARRGRDNIGHDAHFFGALYGIMYIFIIQPDKLGEFSKAIGYYMQNIL